MQPKTVTTKNEIVKLAEKQTQRQQRADLQDRVSKLRALMSDARQRAKDGEKNFHEQMELKENLGVATRRLEQFESNIVTDSAMKWGVEISNNPDWWDDDRHVLEEEGVPPDMLDSVSSRWLNVTGRAIIRKRIGDAKFERFKRVAEILIPILSLVVAILALLKA